MENKDLQILASALQQAMANGLFKTFQDVNTVQAALKNIGAQLSAIEKPLVKAKPKR